MLDIYTDLTQVYGSFGGHIELLEVEELAALRNKVDDAAIQHQLEVFQNHFDLQHDCPPEALRKAAITSVALEQLAATYKLGSLVYYYKGSGNPEHEEALSTIILGNSLLTAKGIPVAGEYEIKNAVAMKIMDSLGAGGSFTEFYAIDYTDDVVLMAEGKTKVRPLNEFHGKVGRGLSVEMQVSHGPVTLLSVAEKKGGGLFLLTAEGQSVPGPILQIGNTNSRYQFTPGARRFVQEWNSHGPAHHCAVGTGHRHSEIEKLGKLLHLDVVRVC
jgi:L-arabinose isomerase